MQRPLPQQVELGAAVHLSLDQLETIDLSLDRSIVPGLRDCCPHGIPSCLVAEHCWDQVRWAIDPSALQSGLNQLANGTSLTALETALLGSPEAQAKGITSADFARLLTPDFTGTIGPGTAVTGLEPDGITTGLDPDTTISTIGGATPRRVSGQAPPIGRA